MGAGWVAGATAGAGGSVAAARAETASAENSAIAAGVAKWEVFMTLIPSPRRQIAPKWRCEASDLLRAATANYNLSAVLSASPDSTAAGRNASSA